MEADDILDRVRKTVRRIEPDATLILYGSRARNDHRPDSDLDLLILLDREKVTAGDRKRVTYPLYDLEFETGQIISAMVIGRQEWDLKHKATPFYEAVRREGQILQ